MTTRNVHAYNALRNMGLRPALAWRLAHRASIVAVLVPSTPTTTIGA